MSRFPVAILGPGRVGAAVGAALVQSGWPVVACAARSAAASADSAAFIGGSCAPVTASDLGAALVASMDPSAEGGVAGLLLVCVPDPVVAGASSSDALGTAVLEGESWVMAHTAGALTASVLGTPAGSPLLGSMHPSQTFSDRERGQILLPGVSWGLETDSDDARSAMEALVGAMGGRPRSVAAADKTLYHAGCVLAGNALVALMDAASSAQGGDPFVALEALRPLAEGALDSAARLGPEAALTGPVARGDAALVAEHMAALAAARPDLVDTYRALSKRALDVARRAGLDEAAADAVERALEIG